MDPVPKRPLGVLHHTISTLDPTRIKESDFVDISLRPQVKLYTTAAPPSGLGHQPSRCAAIRYTSICDSKPIPRTFPPDTTGFFYYHVPPNLPLIAGQIRFRVIKKATSWFESGTDLGEEGMIYGLPLLKIARHLSESRLDTYQYLQDLLLADGLVSEALLRRCARMPLPPVPVERIIYDINQPFLVHFNQDVHFSVVGRLGSGRCHHPKLRHIWKNSRTGKFLYQGKGLLRLERSTFLEHPHGSLVARVIKILQPPTLLPGAEEWATKYLPAPKEGELVYKGIDTLEPWTTDVDDEPDLCVLFD